MCRAAISSQCLRSPGSRARINVAFHELGHWTGHKSRLDRDLKNRFGSRNYAAEELIAELVAAFLCAEFGFDGDVRNAGYIASWIELLKADKWAFFTACIDVVSHPVGHSDIFCLSSDLLNSECKFSRRCEPLKRK